MKLAASIVLVACGSKPAREESRPATPPVPVPVVPTPDAMPAEAFVIVMEAEAPTKAAELQRWLADGRYKTWAHESKQHPSDGPHAETVITFLSPLLERSLAMNAKSHPKGVASVKELYKAGKHMGWAVSVKTDADSASGKNWYWYEVFGTAPDAKAPYQGAGVELCRDCHTEGGVDQILVPFPLK